MVAEIGPSEPLFGIIVGCFLVASTFVTFWLLFGSPRASRDANQTNSAKAS